MSVCYARRAAGNAVAAAHPSPSHWVTRHNVDSAGYELKSLAHANVVNDACSEWNSVYSPLAIFIDNASGSVLSDTPGLGGGVGRGLGVTRGLAVGVGLGVAVELDVGVAVAVAVGVTVAVAVGVAVGVDVAVGVGLAVGVGVGVPVGSLNA